MKNGKKLLVCTQVMDTGSSSLGFMTRWVGKLAAEYEQITVICLYKGEYNLPENVKVISLGKENFEKDFLEKNNLYKKIITKIKYTLYFYFFILKEIKNYNKIFVHQNDIYVLMGGAIWKFFAKPIYLWRNHYKGNIFTTLAGKFCEKVFYTSASSFTATFQNAMQMPVGVDVESLEKGEVFEVSENSVLMLARLDPSKKPEIILKAFKKLQEDGVRFTASFVGGVSKDKFPNYEAEIFKLKEDLNLGESIRFVGAVPSTETHKYYLTHDVYVNVSKSGMLDKTIFKALAAGCVPITTSLDFNEMIFDEVKDEFKVQQDNVESLVEKLKHVLAMDKEHKKHKVKLMQDVVLEKQSLNTLIKKLSAVI